MKRTVKILLYVFFVIYCLALVKFLLLEGRYHTENSIEFYIRRSNFIPFKTVWDYIVKLSENRIELDIVIRNLAGNLIVLFPMGCFLPCMFKKFQNIGTAIALCFGIVLFVELLQMILRIGFLDVDDFILNLGGAALGYLFVHIPFFNKLLQKTYVYKA